MYAQRLLDIFACIQFAHSKDYRGFNWIKYCCDWENSALGMGNFSTEHGMLEYSSHGQLYKCDTTHTISCIAIWPFIIGWVFFWVPCKLITLGERVAFEPHLRFRISIHGRYNIIDYCRTVIVLTWYNAFIRYFHYLFTTKLFAVRFFFRCLHAAGSLFFFPPLSAYEPSAPTSLHPICMHLRNLCAQRLYCYSRVVSIFSDMHVSITIPWGSNYLACVCFRYE